MEPSNHRAHLELGLVKLKMKQEDEAIQYFLKAYNIDKNDPVSSFQLAYIYKERKLYTQAIIYYTNALRINPNDMHSLLFIGTCEYKVNNKSENAIKYLKKALEINQNLPDAYQMLGDCYFNKNDAQNAKFYLYKTLEYCKTGLATTYF